MHVHQNSHHGSRHGTLEITHQRRRQRALARSSVYQTDPHMRYTAEEVWFAASLYVLSWEQDFHQLMLNDHIRMVAYEKAIKTAIRPGMAVADLGTGTGILAQWALEAGARVVHAIDVNEAILRQARERIARAGFADRLRTYAAMSYDVALPEKVDVLVSEILGNLGDNEGMTPILNDARARFLKQGGHMLPRRAQTFLVPVAAVRAHRQLQARRCRGLSDRYDLGDLLARLHVRVPFDIYYDVILPSRLHLAPPARAARFAFDGHDQDDYLRDITFTVRKAGLFTGFKGYFKAELVDGVVLDISGDDIGARTTSDSWKHCYLPVERPVEVRAGDAIELAYRRSPPAAADSPFRQRLSWSGRVRRGQRTLAAFQNRMD
jgi:type I protein arginine methyltransferase